MRKSHVIFDWDEGYKYYKVLQVTNEIVWITTRYGLIRFNKQDLTFYTFTTKEGLISNNINESYIDERGLFWLATDNGISRFDPKQGIYKLYADRRIKYRYSSDTSIYKSEQT